MRDRRRFFRFLHSLKPTKPLKSARLQRSAKTLDTQQLHSSAAASSCHYNASSYDRYEAEGNCAHEDHIHGRTVTPHLGENPLRECLPHAVFGHSRAICCSLGAWDAYKVSLRAQMEFGSHRRRYTPYLMLRGTWTNGRFHQAPCALQSTSTRGAEGLLQPGDRQMPVSCVAAMSDATTPLSARNAATMLIAAMLCMAVANAATDIQLKVPSSRIMPVQGQQV